MSPPFHASDRAGPIASRSGKIAARAFGIAGFRREGAPASSACSARGFCSDFGEMGTLHLGGNIDHIATLREARYATMPRSKNDGPDPIEAASICRGGG